MQVASERLSMPSMKTAAGILGSALCLLAATTSPRWLGDEPPLQLALELDGKEHLLTAGQETMVEVGGAKVRAKVRVLPLRHFQAAGIAFDYPQDMTWSHEKDNTWHLNHADLRLSVWTFASGDAQKHAAVLVQASAKSLGGAEASLEAVQLPANGGPHGGVRAQAATKDGRLARHIEAYGFTAAGKPVVLMLIGAPEDFAKPDASGAMLRDLIARTLRTAD